eukprot:219534-Hanusia_phi.AAC.1
MPRHCDRIFHHGIIDVRPRVPPGPVLGQPAWQAGGAVTDSVYPPGSDTVWPYAPSHSVRLAAAAA